MCDREVETSSTSEQHVYLNSSPPQQQQSSLGDALWQVMLVKRGERGFSRDKPQLGYPAPRGQS